MDNETPELIEAQMAETRQSLTDKVAALEESVVGTVQSATTAVHDTVQTVRAAVEGTVESVKGNVASAFDVRHHVQTRPWEMIGGAAVAGLLAGMALFRKSPTTKQSVSAAPSNAAPAPSDRSPGLFDAVLGMAGVEIKKLAESAIASASTTLQRVVNEKLPKLVDQIVEPQEKQSETRAPTFPIGRWNGALPAGSR
jgi:ElaB/YqjD/DUF883 family membrane-anchored ribosome-binding protein